MFGSDESHRGDVLVEDAGDVTVDGAEDVFVDAGSVEGHVTGEDPEDVDLLAEGAADRVVEEEYETSYGETRGRVRLRHVEDVALHDGAVAEDLRVVDAEDAIDP